MIAYSSYTAASITLWEPRWELPTYQSTVLTTEIKRSTRYEAPNNRVEGWGNLNLSKQILKNVKECGFDFLRWSWFSCQHFFFFFNLAAHWPVWYMLLTGSWFRQYSVNMSWSKFLHLGTAAMIFSSSPPMQTSFSPDHSLNLFLFDVHWSFACMSICVKIP